MTEHDPYMLAAARSAAKGELLKGFLWLVGGGLVSGITYLAADPGGTYVVFWGALAYGAFRFLRALYFWANPSALIGKA